MPLAAPSTWKTFANEQLGSPSGVTGTHCWEVEIDFDGATTQNMSTSYTSVGANAYQPYVIGISDLEFGFRDDSNVGSLAGCDITLRRGVIEGSGQTMDDRYAVSTILGKPVRIYSRFIETSLARVPIAQLIVQSAEILDMGSIRIGCVNDERVLVDFPTLRMDDFGWGGDKPPLYDGTRPVPFVIGALTPTAAATMRKWEVGRAPGGAAVESARLIPESSSTPELRGGAHFVISRYDGTFGVPAYALQYVDSWDSYARMVAAGQVGTDTDSTVVVYQTPLSFQAPMLLQTYNPGSTINAVARAAEKRAMAVEFDGTYSSAVNGHQNTAVGAVGLNDAAITLTVGGTTKLSLTRSNSGGTPPDYKATPTGLVRRLCYNASNFTGGSPTLNIYEGTTSTDSVGAALATHTTAPGMTRLTLSSSWDCNNLFVKFLVSGSGSVTLGDVYLEFEYYVTQTIFQRFRIWESGREQQTHFGAGHVGSKHMVYDYKHADINKAPEGNKLVVAFNGDITAARSGGYGYANPTGCLYYYLYWLLGVPIAEIDTTSFGAMQTYYVTDTANIFNTWICGRQLQEVTPSISILSEACAQFGLLLFRSGDKLWKLAAINHAVGTIVTFGDALSDYPAWDFRWSFSPEFQNAFTFNYRWDPVRQKFGKSFRVDKDATVSSFLTSSKTACSTAFTAYGAEAEAPAIDLFWTPETTTAENIAKIIVNYATLRRRVVTFTTKLSGLVIEPGDAIRTSHANQTWTTASVTFQVRNVRIMTETGEMEITAYEINELT